MLKELIKLASELDLKGFTKEADALDQIIKLSGRRVVEKIGDVKIYKDSDWGEYTVVPKGATPTCDSAYHTDDMEDAIDTARAMVKKEMKKEAASTHDMIDHDLRIEEERNAARVVMKEAFRRANRDDISGGMKEEFYEDILGGVAKLIQRTTEDIKNFNMDIVTELEERDEPTEIAPSHKGNPNDPWDALFPPKM